VAYDRLDPAALAASPGLQEPVQDIPDLVGRLAKLKDCYRPSPDQSQKLETAARTFLVARQSIEEIVKVARAQQVEGASELEAVWQNLGADVARADALPRVAANGDRMVETYDRARRTLLAQGYLKSLEWALRYCYRPEEEPPWFAGGKTTAARNLSDTWRRGEPAVGVEVNAEIATRLQTLHAVQAIQEKSVLVDKAKSPEVQVEAVWYAWWRLDRLPAYRWPQTLQDWEEEQFLQKKLRQGLTARALGPSRLESLLGTVTDANGTRETTFRKAMVDNRIQAISAHSHSDLFLNTLAAQGSSRIRTAREARTWETTTTNLATFVAEPGWTDKYDLVRFYGKEGKGTGIMDRVLARGVVATQDVDDWRQALTTYLKKAELPAAVAPVRPPAPAPSGPKPVAPSLALTGVGSADLVVQIPGGKGGSPVRLEMKRIPAQGLWFRMGIPAGSIKQTGDPLEQTKQLTKDFYIGKFEVTQAQYWAVMGADLNSRASAAPIDPNRPIENVSWQDAARFCERLNQMEKGNRFRLPTEMEWEYACRGQRGGKTWKELPDYFEYFTGDGEAALRRAGRYRASSLGGTERAGPVGQWHEGRHIWELYDMHGNVWEWCSDEYPDSSSQGGTSPKRAIRGGAYDSRAEECRSAWRDGRRQEEASPNIGFRLVREVE
jgi:formylglycine-generating enzyme required for sulfatase activity